MQIGSVNMGSEKRNSKGAVGFLIYIFFSVYEMVPRATPMAKLVFLGQPGWKIIVPVSCQAPGIYIKTNDNSSTFQNEELDHVSRLACKGIEANCVFLDDYPFPTYEGN